MVVVILRIANVMIICLQKQFVNTSILIVVSAIGCWTKFQSFKALLFLHLANKKYLFCKNFYLPAITSIVVKRMIWSIRPQKARGDLWKYWIWFTLEIFFTEKMLLLIIEDIIWGTTPLTERDNIWKEQHDPPASSLGNGRDWHLWNIKWFRKLCPWERLLSLERRVWFSTSYNSCNFHYLRFEVIMVKEGCFGGIHTNQAVHPTAAADKLSTASIKNIVRKRARSHLGQTN